MSYNAGKARPFQKFAGVAAAAVLLPLAPLACDRGAASDVVAPNVLVKQASIGSVITSDVVTTTTICAPTGTCRTRKSNSRLAQRVGEATDKTQLAPSLTMLAASPVFSAKPHDRTLSPRNPGRGPPELAEGALRNIHVTGATLSADRTNSGHNWHVELTRDRIVRDKFSGVRLYRDGQVILASNAQWDDVAGVSYRRHTELTLYRGGRVALHQEKSFSPVSVEAGAFTQDFRHSSENLTLRAVFAPDEFPDGCPVEIPICEFLQSANPIPILNGAVSSLAWIATSIGNWFNALWAGAGADASGALAENAIATLEAVGEPSLLTIATAIGALARGPITDEVLSEIGNLLAEWIADWLFLFFL